MIALLTVGFVISVAVNIFREISYYICRKDKEKLRDAIKNLIGIHIGSGSAVAKGLEKLLKETYP